MDATDAELIARLRDDKLTWGDRWQAADRFEALAARVAVLEAERDEYANAFKADNAALAEATLRAERLEAALLWCGGSNDFQPGGIADEGWQKVCVPLLWPSATP